MFEQVHTWHKTDMQYFQANSCIRPKAPYSAYNKWLKEVSKEEEKQGNHMQSSFSSVRFSHRDFLLLCISIQ